MKRQRRCKPLGDRYHKPRSKWPFSLYALALGLPVMGWKMTIFRLDDGAVRWKYRKAGRKMRKSVAKG